MTLQQITELDDVTSGDVGEYQDIVLNGVDNLDTLTTVTGVVSKNNVGVPVAVTVVDSATSTVRLNYGTDIGDWLPARPDTGVWLGQVAVVFNDGSDWTWPKGSWFQIRVNGEL